jgi:hypothetical protein
MAVAMLLTGEAVTKESYEALTRQMFGSYPMRTADSPDGLILHTAGPTPEGWYVYDIWESKEHFERFLQQKLGPAVQELVGDDGARPEPQFYEIEILVHGN